MANLTKIQVDALKETGRHGDGRGLWLQVHPGGSKSWLFRYSLPGRPERSMGLGLTRT